LHKGNIFKVHLSQLNASNVTSVLKRQRFSVCHLSDSVAGLLSGIFHTISQSHFMKYAIKFSYMQ